MRTYYMNDPLKKASANNFTNSKETSEILLAPTPQSSKEEVLLYF